MLSAAAADRVPAHARDMPATATLTRASFPTCGTWCATGRSASRLVYRISTTRSCRPSGTLGLGKRSRRTVAGNTSRPSSPHPAKITSSCKTPHLGGRPHRAAPRLSRGRGTAKRTHGVPSGGGVGRCVGRARVSCLHWAPCLYRHRWEGVGLLTARPGRTLVFHTFFAATGRRWCMSYDTGHITLRAKRASRPPLKKIDGHCPAGNNKSP